MANYNNSYSHQPKKTFWQKILPFFLVVAIFLFAAAYIVVLGKIIPSKIDEFIVTVSSLVGSIVSVAIGFKQLLS